MLPLPRRLLPLSAGSIRCSHLSWKCSFDLFIPFPFYLRGNYARVWNLLTRRINSWDFFFDVCFILLLFLFPSRYMDTIDTSIYSFFVMNLYLACISWVHARWIIYSNLFFLFTLAQPVRTICNIPFHPSRRQEYHGIIRTTQFCSRNSHRWMNNFRFGVYLRYACFIRVIVAWYFDIHWKSIVWLVHESVEILRHNYRCTDFITHIDLACDPFVCSVHEQTAVALLICGRLTYHGHHCVVIDGPKPKKTMEN